MMNEPKEDAAHSKKRAPGKRRYRVVREKSCGVILYHLSEQQEALFLLLHYPGGHWDFPKGHVEETDATEKGTAFRELQEETGISTIRFLPRYRMAMHYHFFRGYHEKVKKMVVYFLAVTQEKEVRLSHEHQSHEWLPYKEAMARLTFDNARILLEAAKTQMDAMPVSALDL